MEVMKKIPFLLLLLFVSGGAWAADSIVSVAGQASVEAVMKPETVNMKPETTKRKKNKGYKKPKKKKFLGIFKRKSSCDCPKH
ncbi:MAG: hypothetical protein ABS46_05060 [Cytophagaceae bacterium SCN 52-12]|nr:MAG: hypothetical protein ABS46_05060 [Cytophagaceae bacterium SCN 52-12]